MHDRDARLIEILSSCEYDRSRLSDADHASACNLARAAGIELYRPGVAWPSSPGAEDRGGEITRIDAARPR